jgi:hypothetical protein
MKLQVAMLKFWSSWFWIEYEAAVVNMKVSVQVLYVRRIIEKEEVNIKQPFIYGF